MGGHTMAVCETNGADGVAAAKEDVSGDGDCSRQRKLRVLAADVNRHRFETPLRPRKEWMRKTCTSLQVAHEGCVCSDA